MSGGNSGLTMAMRMDESINVILHALAWALAGERRAATGIVACGRYLSVARDYSTSRPRYRSPGRMETELMRSDESVYALEELFQPPEAAAARQVVQSKLFMRTEW